MPSIRTDVLQFPREDGGLDIVDLVMDRFHRFDAAEVSAIEADEEEIWTRLGTLFLVEGPIAEQIREQQWAARAKGVPGEVAPAQEEVWVDWALAESLPAEVVSPHWRDGERLRRVAEDHAAGRRVLVLRGFFCDAWVQRLKEAIDGLTLKRFETDLVKAERCYAAADELGLMRRFFEAETTRLLFGGLLHRTFCDTTVINVWRLLPGDYFRAHIDGRYYEGTFSVGLCDDWSAKNGGAIAFGDPTSDGFETHERWLPHAGDLCLFRPHEARWHAVEPVNERARLTATGWWYADPNKA